MKATEAIPKAININVSIKANATIVVVNNLSYSSGFLDTAMLNEENKIPVLSAAKATGNIIKANVSIFTPFIISIGFFNRFV